MKTENLIGGSESKLCPGVCNLLYLPGTSCVTLSMVMHITKPHMYSLRRKKPSSWRNTHANRRNLTLVWWFTSASFLRRSSTIWSGPFQLAICNAVWPVCTCIGGNFHTIQQLFTATSWFCVGVMRPKVGEEPGNGGTWLHQCLLTTWSFSMCIVEYDNLDHHSTSPLSPAPH